MLLTTHSLSFIWAFRIMYSCITWTLDYVIPHVFEYQLISISECLLLAPQILQMAIIFFARSSMSSKERERGPMCVRMAGAAKISITRIIVVFCFPHTDCDERMSVSIEAEEHWQKLQQSWHVDTSHIEEHLSLYQRSLSPVPRRSALVESTSF